jgi:hypothetical protein
MTYVKNKIDTLLRMKSDPELREVMEKLLPPKTLSLLPSLILTNPGSILIHLEYDLKNGYQQREVMVRTYTEEVLRLSDTKFLIFHGRNFGYQGGIYCYDLVTNLKIKFDLPKFDTITPINSLSSVKSEFSIANLGEVSDKLKILEISKKNPKKFKLKYEKLPFEIVLSGISVIRISLLWLLITNIHNQASAFYRSVTNSNYELKKRFTLTGEVCAGGKDLLVIEGWYYQNYTFHENGDITVVKLAENSNKESNLDSVCLGNGMIGSFNKTKQSYGYEFHIQSFSEEVAASGGDRRSPHTQIIHFAGKKPISITDNHFIKIDSELEIWMRTDKDYFLYSLIPINLNLTNGDVIPLFPTEKARSSIVKYLTSLIKLPKDLISSTIEFF